MSQEIEILGGGDHVVLGGTFTGDELRRIAADMEALGRLGLATAHAAVFDDDVTDDEDTAIYVEKE